MQSSIARLAEVAKLESIKNLRDRLNTVLIRTHIERERCADLILAMSELVTNIVRHARPRASQVIIELCQTNSEWALRVYDDGGSFDTYQQNIQHHQQHSYDDSQMGLGMVVALFPLQDYQARSETNHVFNCFSLRLTFPEIEQSIAIRDVSEENIDDQLSSIMFPVLPPQIGNLRVSVRTRKVIDAGGNFICHRSGENGDMLVIGNIASQGDQAQWSSQTSYIHGLMTTLPQYAGPAECLEAISTDIAQGGILGNAIVTCAVIHILDNDLIRIANAGNPLPLVVSTLSPPLRYIDIDGALPGLFPETHYREHALQISNDRLILYTDGLFETSDSASQRQQLESNIRRCMIKTATQSIHSASDQVMEVFDVNTVVKLQDDASLIILESTNRKN